MSTTLEACNGLDEDCDGIIDEGEPALLCPGSNATTVCSRGQCSVASCIGPYGDCDGIAANGCEEPLNTLTSCGSCGTVCALGSATASCDSGNCEIVACDTHWGDCDGQVANGCETSLTTLSDCGSCSQPCNLAGTSETCVTGSCRVDTCAVNLGDCDGDPANGCETDLTSLTDCGGCGAGCDYSNASESCSAGTCTFGACHANWGDCNMRSADGCETSLRTLTDCGACGATCTLANATASCATGSCQIASCDADRGDCVAASINGCETNLTTLNDCGSCGAICDYANASETCPGGTCTFGSCDDTNEASGRIYRANLDGSGQQTIITSSPEPRGFGNPDVVNGKLYHVDSGNDRIQRSNLDGSNIETLVSSGIIFPKDIVLY